jgi:16S rRNA (guanine966-N2)-methyltransferase
MRVIGGSAKSLRLTVPRGCDLRPTPDMVKEALFASLGPLTIDCCFGDLYAGTGSVGIEALSRGARSCIFIERDPRCLAALRENLTHTGLAGQGRLLRGTVLSRLVDAWTWGPPDIVFVDPPYRESTETVLAALTKLVNQGTRPCQVIIQCARGSEPTRPASRTKRYGGTVLLTYDLHPEMPPEPGGNTET